MINDWVNSDIPSEFWLMGAALVVMGLMLVFLTVRERLDVRRRTQFDAPRSSGYNQSITGAPQEVSKLFEAHTFSVDSLIAFVNKALDGDEKSEGKVLKAQLIQAGFFSERAVAIYFIVRLSAALVLAFTAYFILPNYITIEKTQNLALVIVVSAIIGYLAPGFYISRRIEQRQTECRMGFPDFMDLMVVCAEAGLSLEASIERVSRELSQGYPALGQNLYMMALEVRAGKRIVDAMLRMAERIGIAEARSLATLLQQSCELGSSLSHSLKIYSDDMRHKRMSRAEEKAYALPAKLVVPLILFVFPVLLVTLLFPAIVRIVWMS